MLSLTFRRTAYPVGWMVLLALLAVGAEAAEPRLPFPHHVSYASGSLRPSQRTQAQQEALRVIAGIAASIIGPASRLSRW